MNPSFFLMMLKFYIDMFNMFIYIYIYIYIYMYVCRYVSCKQGKIVRHIRLVRAAFIGKTQRDRSSSSKQVSYFSAENLVKPLCQS